MYNYFSLSPHLIHFCFWHFLFSFPVETVLGFKACHFFLCKCISYISNPRALVIVMKPKGMKMHPSQWFTGRTGPRKPSWLPRPVQDSFRQDVAAATNPLLAPWNKAQKGQVSLGPDGVIRKALTPKTLTLTLRILTIESKQNRK